MTREYSYNLISADEIHCEKVNDEVYMLTRDFYCVVLEEGTNLTYLIKIQRGFMWNGASVPKLFQWFLPNFDKENNLYNVAALVHDAMYASKLWNRFRADDLFRSILRDAGVSRFKAGLADKILIFAGSHYGDDEYSVAHLVTID